MTPCRLVCYHMVYDESEYYLVLQNVVNEHDYMFMDDFMAWLRVYMCKETWDRELSDIWRDYSDE